MKKIIPGDNIFILINDAIVDSNSAKELYTELNDLTKQLTRHVGVNEEYKDALLNITLGLKVIFENDTISDK